MKKRIGIDPAKKGEEFTIIIGPGREYSKYHEMGGYVGGTDFEARVDALTEQLLRAMKLPPDPIFGAHVTTNSTGFGPNPFQDAFMQLFGKDLPKGNFDAEGRPLKDAEFRVHPPVPRIGHIRNAPGKPPPA